MKKQLFERLSALEQYSLELNIVSLALIDCSLANLEEGDQDKVANSLIGLKEYLQYYEEKLYNKVKQVWKEVGNEN